LTEGFTFIVAFSFQTLYEDTETIRPRPAS
jgi:hypothetical protein